MMEDPAVAKFGFEVIVNDALVAPARTVTEAGTVATEGLAE
jgi:hypothetical protein